jgi:hypothetical protein
MFGRTNIMNLVLWDMDIYIMYCCSGFYRTTCLLASLLAVHFRSQTRIKFQLPLDLVQESHSSAYKQEPHLHIVFPRRLKCYNDASCDANNVCFTLRCLQISVYELCSLNSCEGRDMLCALRLTVFVLLETNDL